MCSRTHCYHEKASVVIILYVFVALGIQHANRIFFAQRYTVICGLSDSIMLSHIISCMT